MYLPESVVTLEGDACIPQPRVWNIIPLEDKENFIPETYSTKLTSTKQNLAERSIVYVTTLPVECKLLFLNESPKYIEFKACIKLGPMVVGRDELH